MIILLTLALILIIIGSGLLILLEKQRKKLGILREKNIYHDTQQTPGKILYGKTLNLIGKPDYIIKIGNTIMPVEIKTGKTPENPYLNHTMQLMAYCLLIEENFNIRPIGGIVKYPEKEFKIQYTKEAEVSIRELVNEITYAKENNKEFHCKHQEHYKTI